MTSRSKCTKLSRTRIGAASRVLGALAAVGLVAGCGTHRDGAMAQAERHWQLLDRYCTECHNSTEYTAELALDALGPEDIGAEAEAWEKVVRKLRGRMMPPPGGPRPDTAEVDALVGWLEARLDSAVPEADPGYVALHRMNRTEYANAVRDLLGIDVDAEALLPVDGAEAGFDNVANALQVSPSFIDQYLNAARTLAALAVGDPAPRAVGVPYSIASTEQRGYVEGLPLGTRGGALIEHYFPSDGDYLLNIGDLVTGLWGFNQEHAHTLIATLDGRRFFELDIGGGEDLRKLDQIGAPAVDEINAQLKNIPFTTTAGLHEVGVTFVQRSFAESDRQLHLLTPGTGQDAVLTIDLVEIFGPVRPTGLSATTSRARIFGCYPEAPDENETCARQIVSELAARAFRGAAGDADIERLMALYALGAENGGFEEGVEYALSGVLAHPKFLYRLEPSGDGSASGGARPLTSLELASRLSFFLWSTIPDAALLDAAANGGLRDAAKLEREVRRMLEAPRSETLASNFAYQWLGLGELEAIDPDPTVFGDVAADIRSQFVTEARLFVDSIFREDRSVLDLLTADHTYLNESLALHYGINELRGNRFRRVQLDDERRFGLLGKGGVLMASSYPNRTSPVLRGAWLLEHLLGTPPAAPPPDVEGLAENIAGEDAVSVRDRLEAHRGNVSCNSCHGIIDPLGFALENYDAVGRWRDKDREAGTPIDASGVLADGTIVDGPLELRAALLARPEQFVQTLTEKLMTYALGRSLGYRDMPTVRRIVREAAAQNYRFSAIVLGIVRSPQFQKQGAPPGDPAMLSAGATRE